MRGVPTFGRGKLGENLTALAGGGVSEAGVKICAVRYGYGKPDDLARWAPDYWISDLRELLQQA